VSLVGFDLHPPAAAEPLLPPPEFAVDELKIDFQAGRQARNKGDQRLAVRLSRSEVTKLRLRIVSDEKELTENRELISDY
jgi:hypothetical protein